MTLNQNPHPERGPSYTEKVMPFFLVKADADLGQVTAIVSVFGVVDDGRDRILPGSFVKTISEMSNRIRVLDQHNTDSTSRVLGRPIEMREVGREELPAAVLSRFPSATGGLLTVTQYNMKTQSGSETFYRIAAEDINEYSIGFNAFDTQIVQEIIDGKKTTVRNIRTVKLWEFSPVIWGMNPATATVDAKAGANQMPADMTNKDYQEETETAVDGKPVTLLGDKIHACLTQSMVGLLSWLYEDGWLSFDEFTALQTNGMNALVQFRGGMSPDIANREYEHQFYYMLMNGSPVDSTKAQPIDIPPVPVAGEEEKAGGASAPPPPEAVPQEDPAGPSAAATAETPTDPLVALRARAQNLDRKLQLLGGIPQ